MKRLILAMSDYRREIRRNITSVSAKIDEHIAKLCLYPHAQEVNHWKKEITSFLYRINKMKSSNKFPSYDFILEALQVSNDVISETIEYVMSEESDLEPVEKSEKDILQAIVNYQEWLATALSSKGIINVKEAYQKLSEFAGCD